jgi:hypothetical protein
MTSNKQTGAITLLAEGRRTANLRLKARFDPARWTYVPVDRRGPLARTNQPSVDQALLEAVRAAGPEGLTYRDFDTFPGLSSDKAKKRFPAMAKDGLIHPSGRGTKGDPKRWIHADSVR